MGRLVEEFYGLSPRLTARHLPSCDVVMRTVALLFVDVLLASRALGRCGYADGTRHAGAVFEGRLLQGLSTSRLSGRAIDSTWRP